jgi:hypothetical protein
LSPHGMSKSCMQALAFTLRGRVPMEQHEQFQWIAETVVERTNTLRGGSSSIIARHLFEPYPGRYTKGPRLLTVFLVRTLLSWPASTLNAIFSPGGSFPHSNHLSRQSQQWVHGGCLDAFSGLSMAPIKEHVLNAFRVKFLHALQNPAVNEPPDPPPKPDPAAYEMSQPKPRKQAAKASSRDTRDEPDAHPPAQPARVLAVPSLPPVRLVALIGLDEELAKAPFLSLFHPALVKAAVLPGDRVREFIAEMIAAAMRQKASITPLAPQPFLQVLSCASLDVPEPLVPHAEFIQKTLCEFAGGSPAHSSLLVPGAFIRSARPVAPALGD